MKPLSTRFVVLFCLCWGVCRLGAESVSSLAYLEESGRLAYGEYANRGEGEALNRLPDFSMCGYRGGGVALPTDVPIFREIEASDADQLAIIQGAIDDLAQEPLNMDGFRGVILLKAGLHHLSGPVVVGASGIVLRGEGQLPAAEGGTELVATQKEQHDLIQFKGVSSAIRGAAVQILDDYVGTGSDLLTLQSVDGLSEGQGILVSHTPNQLWIDTLEVGQWGWTTSGYEIDYERRITSLEGNAIRIDSPLVQPIRSVYGGGTVQSFEPSGRVLNCGIENMYISSEYANDADEAHGWSAIYLEYTEDCWVKQVTARYFGYGCVRLNRAYFSTIEDCAMLDPKSQTTGGRKYSFTIDDGSFNLFQRLYTRGGRHDVVTGSRVPGPNVFLDAYLESNVADPGPHHRYATGALFDNIQATSSGSTDGLYVENRQDSGTGHGWSGAQIVFWNCKANNFICDAPQTAMNFNIGYDGNEREGRWAPEEPRGFWEEGDPFVFPRSLYLSQLKDRLGVEAVLRVATMAQLTGDLWEELEEWKGLGVLNDGSSANAGMSLSDWLSDRGLSSAEAHLPDFGMRAKDVFLTGLDLRDEPSSRMRVYASYDVANRWVVEIQARLSSAISFETSLDLGEWESLADAVWVQKRDYHFGDGTRQLRWEASTESELSAYFRIRNLGM